MMVGELVAEFDVFKLIMLVYFMVFKDVNFVDVMKDGKSVIYCIKLFVFEDVLFGFVVVFGLGSIFDIEKEEIG